MTRFKELRRIERTIENKDVIELRWAEEYCKWRLEHGVRKANRVGGASSNVFALRKTADK